MPKKVLFLLLLLFFVSSTVEAGIYEKYSDTIQIVFERLEGQKNKTINTVKEKDEERMSVEGESPIFPETTSIINENEKKIQDQENDKIVIPSLSKQFEGSILERMQKESTVSLNSITEGVDNFATNVYKTASGLVIGISPVLIIIGALLLLFTKGKAVGLMLIVIVAIFAILNAPEIVKILLNFIMNIFQ